MNGGPAAAALERRLGATGFDVGSLARWARGRVHSRLFWAVQSGVLAVTALHYYLEATGTVRSVEHTIVILYVIPITVAALAFSREGGIATSIWAGLLTVPNVLVWHLHDYVWLEDFVPTMVIVSVGIVLASRVDGELRQRGLTATAQAELQRLASRYRSLFESAGDAVLVFDETGRLLLANSAASTQLGHGLKALETTTLADALGPLAAAPLMRIFAADDEAVDDPARGRMQLVLSDGELPAKVMDVAWARVEDPAHHALAQAVLRDVTLQREREESLRLYAQQVTLAQERERQRIARELHDEAAQMLVSLCQGLDQLGSPRQSGAQSPTPDALRELAKQALTSIRRFARNLRPTLLDDLGLIAAIHWLVSDMGQRLGIDARMETAGPSRRLPNDVEVTLFRVVQEALRNTERHARAAHVLVEVDFLEDGATVSITDDGDGFTPPAPLRSLACQGHLGLLGIQERVQMINGSLSVRSCPSEGTRISVHVPDAAISAAAGC